jgi:ABC-type polar amino acid transport system ATPase subunit
MNGTQTADKGDTVLTLEGINKWLGGARGWHGRTTTARHHVLKDIDIELRKGEVLVVIGPSGSGKSTLLRCINMLAPPDSGTVTFFGQRWSAADSRSRNPLRQLQHQRELRQLRRRIGVVFQHFNLFPHKTVLKNVMLALTRVLHLPATEARARALEELHRVGMTAKAGAFPNQLSGGQKQRVAIARAMAMRPDIMLFDEATSALDPEIIEDILGQMQQLAAGGMTMVVVTHEMGFAREVGDRIIFMDEGRIVEQGEAKALIAAPSDPRTRAFLRAIL